MQASKSTSVAGAAGRGALAGLIGGAAMTAAERVVLPRLPGRHAPRVVPWDKRVSVAADLVGWDMSPRSRTAAGITTQLLYAALLGAAYATIVSRKPRDDACPACAGAVSSVRGSAFEGKYLDGRAGDRGCEAAPRRRAPRIDCSCMAHRSVPAQP
jgi:hypothetical protein